MKKTIRGLLLFFCIIATPALANDIYIEQVGDSLDLDITQDGQNNVIGTSTTDVNLDGDSMTFSITQTGDLNTIVADIQGTSYTGTWAFTGDSNAVDLSCDSTSGTNCENVTLNITTTGDDNTYDFSIGDTADADGANVSFTVTGDDNVIKSDIDGESVALTVVINNSSSLATSGATSGTLSSNLKALELSIKIALLSLITGNHFFEIEPPADAKTKSIFSKDFSLTSCVVSSFCFQNTFCPADREEDNKINSEMGNFLSSSIFINSEPTAPEEPRIATLKDFFGKKEDLCKIVENFKIN